MNNSHRKQGGGSPWDPDPAGQRVVEGRLRTSVIDEMKQLRSDRLARERRAKSQDSAFVGGPLTAEQQFCETAMAKRKGVVRAGWPDFIATVDGLTQCIEVKNCDSDRLRPSQVRCFAILERLSIQVYVWVPQKPDVLTPWRRWPREQKTP